MSDPIQALLSKQLDGDEGRRRYAYLDSLGFLTIGKGRLVDKKKPGSGLSEVEIDYLYGNDYVKVLAAVDARMPWLNELDTARKGAVMNMVFQMGVDGVLDFKDSMSALRAKLYEAAAAHMRKSLWAVQTPERAARVIQQIRTGIWQGI